MKVLRVKDSKDEIILSDEWRKLDEDTYVRNVKDNLYELIAVYYIGHEYNSKPYYNVAYGTTCLDELSVDEIQKALNTYSWDYDSNTKQVYEYDYMQEYVHDTEWSGYLIAEAFINHGNCDSRRIQNCKCFNEVMDHLKDDLKIIQDHVKQSDCFNITEYCDEF